MSENIRAIAIDSMIEIMENHGLCHIVVSDTLTKYQYLDKKDRAFYSRLVQGTCENLIYIDYVINSFSKTKTTKMKPFIRNNLRIAVYQIIFLQSIPDSAACNEAVKLTTKRGFSGLRGFVNGVLRNIARDYDKVELPDYTKNKYYHLSVKYSVPEWIIKMWCEQYGDDVTVSMLARANEVGKLTVRACVNPKAANSDDKIDAIIKSLQDNGVTVNNGSYLKEALILSNIDHISNLESFKKGEIYIQDESSMLVAHIADVKNGDFVVDVCAAPGGKTLHLASMLENSGKIIARDLVADKIERIKENALRCNYKNIEIQSYDASKLDESLIGKADVVLADVPCSGLGVIGQKADIRYKTTREDIDELVLIQRDILKTVVKYVKKNGAFIYSTCTVNDYENLENVKWIIENSDLKLESIDEFIPKQLRCDTSAKGYLTLFPGIHNTDGFFIARFVRK